MTRDLIAAEGLWTDQPAANFITIARMENEEIDETKLAGRTVRRFSGAADRLCSVPRSSV